MSVPLSRYGNRLGAGSADPAKVVATPATEQGTPPIEIDRFCRNGQHPDARFQNQINQQANAAVLNRSKQVFAGGDGLTSVASLTSFGAGDRARWRFACRTGPYSHAFYYVVIMHQPTSGYTNNTYGRLDIATNAAGTPAVSSAYFYYGADPTNGSGVSGWSYLRVLQGFVDGITGDTEYYCTFNDVDYGRIVSACVFDLQSMTENTGGYLAQNITTHTPVLNVHRQNAVTVNNDLWQKGGSHVLNWSVNNGTSPITTTSATSTNIIDTTSTTVSSSTPGYTLDMTGKDRLSQTSGVPCVMKAFGKVSGGGLTGTVRIKDSGGSTLATCSITGTTNAWVSSGSFNLPATIGKYDLQFSTSGGTFSLYAVSIYEYG